MSDTEKTDASPQKEDIKVDEKKDMVEEKAKENEKEDEAMETELKDEKEVDEESKMEADNEEEHKEGDKAASQTDSVDASPKKSPKKRKKVEKKEDEEEEELPLGLLERPVVIESGKREKRKVERLSMTMNFNPQQKKPVDVPVGNGAKLGECPRIEYNISHRKTEDLKTLHQVLYGKKGGQKVVKRNLRQFCGFNFTKEDKEYKGRLAALGKLTLSALKIICEVLDLEKMGVKDEVVQRILDFLMNPVDSGRKIPVPKKRGKPAKGGGGGDMKAKGIKRKRTKKKGEKKNWQKKQTSREDVESDDDDEDEDDIGENDKDDIIDEDSDMDDNEDEESEEEMPKKKKAKIETKKPKKDSGEKKEKNDKKEKKERTPKKEKKEPKKKKVEISSDDDDDDDSGSEPLVSKKSGPPNNDELRDVVKKILDGANLEEVTMKTVVKQVYAKYPEFDLTDKKEFIKNTVKQLIS